VRLRSTTKKSWSGARTHGLGSYTSTSVNRLKADIPATWVEYKLHQPIMEAFEEKGQEPDKDAKAKSERLRNVLMENYLHLVRYNAERLHTKLPDEVDVDDLMSAGVFGLMDAIDAFDMERGVKFETYCAPRIRGAIFDELRSMDWVPRLVRARAHKIDGATKQLEVELGRAPTEDELATRLGVDKNEFDKMQKDASAVGVISLSRKFYETDSNKDVREIDVLEDKKGMNPVREMQRKDLKELITKGLSRAERLIIILYYFEEMTMKEIGATLDLSESRVSQMHSSILARLRAQIADRRKEIAETAAV